MIIFDTNAVNRINPHGTRADILRKLRGSGRHRVAVPWMVMEEMIAHQSKDYVKKYQAASEALDALKAEMKWEPESFLEEIALERHQEYWRKPYSEIFELIETSGDAARKALAREAMGLPPAKPGKSPTGGRDAAIWFSLIEYLEANPTEDVYFVTNNHTDFGDGSAYPYPMDRDLPDGHRLTILKDFNEVVARFTQKVEAAQETVDEFLHSSRVRTAVVQLAAELRSIPGFHGLDTSGTSVRWQMWMSEPDAEILRISDVTGHRIEQDTWYTATTDWVLSGLVARADNQSIRRVSCVWTLKILFSTRDDDEPPTLLGIDDPRLPDPNDHDWTLALTHITDRAKERAATRRSAPPGHPRPAAAHFDVASLLPGLNLASALPLNLSSLLPNIDNTRMFSGLADIARQTSIEALMPDLGTAAHNAYIASIVPDLDAVAFNAALALQRGIQIANATPTTSSDPDADTSDEDGPDDEAPFDE